MNLLARIHQHWQLMRRTHLDAPLQGKAWYWRKNPANILVQAFWAGAQWDSARREEKYLRVRELQVTPSHDSVRREDMLQIRSITKLSARFEQSWLDISISMLDSGTSGFDNYSTGLEAITSCWVRSVRTWHLRALLERRDYGNCGEKMSKMTCPLPI
jgi:hypothetical protein